MSRPLVSVVVLNWNGKELCVECLDSVLKTAYSPLEIIVADNGSTDGSVECVRSAFPSVTVLENGENLGYAEGNNRGIAAAKGKYVVTLNNDVVVEPGWLDGLVGFLEKDGSLFAACGRQMNYHDRATIDSLFHYPGPALFFLRAGRGGTMEQNADIARTGRVIAVNGGSAIYRKEMFMELGGFDGAYVFYNEEADLCMRAFLKGWRCLFTPESAVYHREGGSFKGSNAGRLYYHERNRMWFMFKFYPFSFMVRNLLPLALEEMRVIKRDVFVQRAPFRYIWARIHGFAGLFRYVGERRNNVKLFRGIERDFVRFREEKIIPL
jgi:GT2 family glycosyltransferase